MSDKIVNLTITRHTTAPTAVGFGTPLIAGYHTAWVDRVREYSDPAEMLDDGFATTGVGSQLYHQALDMKSQAPTVAKFKIGRRALPFTKTVHLIPTVTEEGYVYEGNVYLNNGTAAPYSYEVQAGDAVVDIVDGLVADIHAITGISAADDLTHATVTTDNAGDWLGIVPSDKRRALNILDATTDPGIATDMAAIIAEDADWYGLLLDSMSEAEILAAAAWVEAQRKIMSVQTADWDTKDAGESTDVLSGLQTAAYDRTISHFHYDVGSDYLSHGIMGRMLPTVPGSATWAHKTLSGVNVDTLSTGEQSALEGKNGNHYTVMGGTNRTYEGKVASGEFIDTIRGTDWLYAEIQTRVLTVLQNNDKVEYTDSGGDLISAAIRAALLQGVQNRFLVDGSILVTVPPVAGISDADKAARILTGITFGAQISGAVHRTTISGKLSL